MSAEAPDRPEPRPEPRPAPRPAPTACIHVCELDPASGLCRGCHRTAGEICAWPGGSGFGAGSAFGAGSVFGGLK